MSGQVPSSSDSPQGPQSPTPAPTTPSISAKAYEATHAGVSPGFAAMLGPSATAEQVQKAMQQAINFIIMELKQEEKKAKEASKHMKDVIEGKDD